MIIAGIDEVGRGAFAGPLVASAVVMGRVKRPSSIKINDSKKLTKKQREVANIWIKNNALAWGIGSVTSTYIDKYGLTKATFSAYRKAIRVVEKKLGEKIDVLMLDAFFLPRTKGIVKSQQFPFIKGDSKSASVAAASIIAKVYRDKLMTKLGHVPKYKKFGWNKNVGYGTKTHRQAIKEYGTTKLHRKLFLRKFT